MTARLLVLARLLALALVLAGCSSADPAPPETEATGLPLLAPGLTVGTTFYGSADVSAQGAAERELLDRAIARGLDGFTVYVDWSDLEAEPGQAHVAELTATLGVLRRLGLTPFVNVTVGDIGDYNLPADLSDGAGGLADGVALDDPAVTDRFGRILDAVAPVVVAHGGFVLGVGNEVDVRLDDDGADSRPRLSGEREAYVRFVEAARERVHAVEPRLAVGVTLTNGAVRRRTATFRALRAVADVVPFNHAPVRPDLTVLDPGAIRADFREVAEAYGDGPILIQELTCPSAPSMGASEAWQRACVERLFAEVRATPRVRFASVFTFQDLDAPTCRAVREALFGDELDDLPADVAARLADYLCSLGLIDPGGAPKPAWSALLDALGART
ncbi:hypothetical protein [Rubrivirga sp.]|uniref:hypothetical protein n=1 Tax=Rubrivirga sp. TaxID=1885344 RepID=UPI003B51FFDB